MIYRGRFEMSGLSRLSLRERRSFLGAKSDIPKQPRHIRRMRGHIELEPQRIAVAVEAAKVQVQNTIEQASGR